MNWKKSFWTMASAFTVACSLSITATAADVPLATFSAPIPVTADSHPFNGAAWQHKPIMLNKYGYVEFEYFASGTANVYNNAPNAGFKLTTTASGPYNTRVIIRRPKDMKKFSGRVVVEIINMTAGYDWTAMWAALWERVVDNGDVYVGITSKPNVFDSMKTFDSTRYASLSMANPIAANEQVCGKLPEEAGYNPNLSKLYENGLAYDIFSQVGALMKTKGATNPIGKPAKYVYLAGESQSGNYLITYYKFVHPLATLSGKPVYDGFIAEASISPSGSPINQCATALPSGDPQIRIPGRSEPIVLINSQWDFYPYRKSDPKPDSNTARDKSRTWEVSGSNHGWTFQYLYGDASEEDLAKIGTSSGLWKCTKDRPEVPLYMPEKAMYEGLIKWVEKGKAPPSANRIVLKPGTYDIEYDANGNALGGLKMPMFAVPIATFGEGHYVLSNGCPEIVPFSSEKLRELYGSNAQYVKRYTAVTEKLVRDGFLLEEDAKTLIRAASNTNPLK